MINYDWIKSTIEKLDNKLSKKAMQYREYIPYSIKDNKFTTRYDENPNWWTNGFWGGLMWIMYNYSNKQCYRDAAEANERMLDKALNNYEKLDHDNGFLWEITSGENYRITQNEISKKRMLYAADILAGRFNIIGSYINAWNGIERQGYSIIDCMMNLPLLYKASEITGYDRFKNIAMAHADKTMEHHVRNDGSVNHIVIYDHQNGEVVQTPAGQGYSSGSSWSRGQAWAIYGFALSYSHTGRIEYLETAKKVAHYFIASICDDYVPKTDFRSPNEPDKRDTSAGMIAAAGLIEIAKYVEKNEKELYLKSAYKIIYNTVEKYADWSDEYDGIIKNGMESYSAGESMYLIYGDYYFADALIKLITLYDGEL